jgi:choline dehydrogenase
MGLPHIADINSPNEPAVGIATIDLTTDASGERHSTMRAFLPRQVAIDRKAHLSICPNTLVSRLAVSHHTEKNPKVGGVFFKSLKDDRTYSCFARKEVILCAGAIANPQLLMLR